MFARFVVRINNSERRKNEPQTRTRRLRRTGVGCGLCAFCYQLRPASAPTTAPQAAAPTTAPQAAAPTAAPKAASGKLRVGLYGQYLQQIDFDKLFANYKKINPNVKSRSSRFPVKSRPGISLHKRSSSNRSRKRRPGYLDRTHAFIEPGALAKLGLVDPLDTLIPKSVWDDVYGGVQKEIKYTGDGKIYTFPGGRTSSA